MKSMQRVFRSGILFALIGALTLMTSPAQASTLTNSSSPSKISCAATKSVAHAPKSLAIPTVKQSYTNKTFTILTNCGTIVIAADGKDAPVTVQVLEYLATSGFYNHSLCHRLTTSGLYVLQCGDPTASGSGGPAFSYGNENLPAATINNYPAGTVAMANSGGSASNGSQFFLVYQNTTLGASYTRWGTITKGLNIIQAIAAQGVVGGGSDGTPVQKIAIESISVK